MLNIVNLPQGAKVLELGGGEQRHSAATCNVDIRPGPGVDFSADFNAPLPLKDDEWDLIICQYCLEHLSWRKVRPFLKEVHRILKAGGHVIFTVPNTEAQIAWAKAHPNGWDGRDAFDSISGVLYGDQDYSDNTHKIYMSPAIAQTLFTEAGFTNVLTQAYGERDTDLAIRANKGTPNGPIMPSPERAREIMQRSSVRLDSMSDILMPQLSREEMYDKHYFNGGGKVGGYAREGYWDFPIHHVTARHILARRPVSVLEIGCARGYVLKRIQDAGILGYGLEISKHCYLTRVANNIILRDICKDAFPVLAQAIGNNQDVRRYDLCYSVATLEHIPEEFLPHVIREMARTCKRGLHGIDFGQHDDGFDKTHSTLRPKEWWLTQFDHHARGWPVEIVDKEELEQGTFPEDVLKGDGKIKLNVGSFSTMTHHGWTNLDLIDLTGFAQANGYRFQQCDVRNGLPYATGTVDLIASCHMLEHLTYKEGLAFLRECRRVLKPDTGGMRILVPDAGLLMGEYNRDLECVAGFNGRLAEFDEINDGCAEAKTPAGKLWALLHEGHHACYDSETLEAALVNAGFVPNTSRFRVPTIFPSRQEQPIVQIVKETLDMCPNLSLVVDCIPLIV
jgi:predicted SAM-dependent methyltransferase